MAGQKQKKPMKSALSQMKKRPENSPSFLDTVKEKVKGMGTRYKPRGK